MLCQKKKGTNRVLVKLYGYFNLCKCRKKYLNAQLYVILEKLYFKILLEQEKDIINNMIPIK